MAPPRRVVDDALFREQWTAGVRTVDMAITHGCGVSTIVAEASRLGLPKRKPGPRPQSDEATEPGAVELDGGRWERDGLVWRWVRPALRGDLLKADPDAPRPDNDSRLDQQSA